MVSFDTTATIQTQRQLLFSGIVEVMCLVVCRVSEQTAEVIDVNGHRLSCRLIRLDLETQLW